MELLKVICTTIAIIDIITIKISFVGLFVLVHETVNVNTEFLYVFFGVIFAAPIVFLLRVCEASVAVGCCGKTYNFKKSFFIYWTGYNAILGIILTVYSLYLMVNLAIHGTLVLQNNIHYYIFMAVFSPLAVIYWMKFIFLLKYYNRKVQEDGTDEHYRQFINSSNDTFDNHLLL